MGIKHHPRTPALTNRNFFHLCSNMELRNLNCVPFWRHLHSGLQTTYPNLEHLATTVTPSLKTFKNKRRENSLE